MLVSENIESAALRREEGGATEIIGSLGVPLQFPAFRSPGWLPRVSAIGILLVTDMVALLIATFVGYLLWIGPVLHQSTNAYLNLVPLLWIFPLGYAGAELYPGFGLGAVEILRRFCYCTSFGFLVMASASFVLKLPEDHSRIAFILVWATSLVSVPLLRFSVLSVVNRSRWWHEPAVLLGSHTWVQKAFQSLNGALTLGYQPVGVLSPDSYWHEPALKGVQVFGGLEKAPLLVERGIRVAIMEEGKERDAILRHLQQYFHRVVVMREYVDQPVEPVQVRNLGGVLGLEFTNNLLRWRNRFIKRTLDAVLGTTLLIFAAPLIAVGAILVKLSSPGPVFFCQRREGLDGCSINVWKLRTMYRDAELRLRKCLLADPELRQEWEQNFKLTHDPRIVFAVGSFLRRFSLDELPQLVGVIFGKMSFVGPRPFPDYHLERLPPEFCALRRRVRPGLTGLWQVTVRSNGGLKEQRMYDTYYIRNWSIWLDAYILGRTIAAVLSGRGAR